MAHSNYEAIYAVVRRIPQGRVATYGQVANVAGLPGHARQVGYALSALPEENDVPWHRVINAQGRISERGLDLGCEALQQTLLLEEKVAFKANGCVDLAHFRWEPDCDGS